MFGKNCGKVSKEPASNRSLEALKRYYVNFNEECKKAIDEFQKIVNEYKQKGEPTDEFERAIKYRKEWLKENMESKTGQILLKGIKTVFFDQGRYKEANDWYRELEQLAKNDDLRSKARIGFDESLQKLQGENEKGKTGKAVFHSGCSLHAGRTVGRNTSL